MNAYMMWKEGLRLLTSLGGSGRLRLSRLLTMGLLWIPQLQICAHLSTCLTSDSRKGNTESICVCGWGIEPMAQYVLRLYY